MDNSKTAQQTDRDDWEGGLDVQGPTIKQELFLRRQGLWSQNLSRGDASWLIEERLKDLRGRQVKTTG